MENHFTPTRWEKIKMSDNSKSRQGYDMIKTLLEC